MSASGPSDGVPEVGVARGIRLGPQFGLEPVGPRGDLVERKREEVN